MTSFRSSTEASLAALEAPDDSTALSVRIGQKIVSDGAVIEHYVVEFAEGAARVVDPDPDRPAEVTLIQNDDVARSLRSGERHAQHAFLTGELTIVGDPAVLTANADALTALSRVLAGRG